MDPQTLANAPSSRLKKYCCKKCGGVLQQTFDQAAGMVVKCGTNNCYPLEIETMTQKTLRESREMEDASKVEQNYPELAVPRMTNEQLERSMNALFPKE
jgi:hypothetical protein